MSEFKNIDARNTFCPGPLMELITYMKQAEVGDMLELLSTDNGTASDVPEWIDKVGHEMISSEKVGDVWHLKVRKLK
ncbi:MAG: sulfurtransferase TusA family protein [Candidatus Thiodiazotropha sp. (ex Ctena orbiculata)]|nr:sulfurtransferase TusA family protein [Candidatus Thiodiazotropha taylori]MBT2995113.1 sulfurtransferase TusA family protein [Candidatus Thiodiazotropha taylori]MBT2999968.1 sulfurtransferase TusA family protein [Candidatus Thiodiazotropha taylori]MBV2105867.1 sulfurtransferase TusA family protein [Candidatus Thiodiazotropha taylori]MBV2109656.1 sulfurtransferase TusA family protein [Candidatus Thiodiazotropha taylori]